MGVIIEPAGGLAEGLPVDAMMVGDEDTFLERSEKGKPQASPFFMHTRNSRISQSPEHLPVPCEERFLFSGVFGKRRLYRLE